MSEGMFGRLISGSGFSAVDVAVIITTTLICIFSLPSSHCQPYPDSLGTLYRLSIDGAGCLTYSMIAVVVLLVKRRRALNDPWKLRMKAQMLRLSWVEVLGSVRLNRDERWGVIETY